MAQAFARGTKAFGFCDRCSWRYPLKRLKGEIQNLVKTSIRTCPTCWDKDHPQLRVGRKRVEDPEGLFDPRPDNNRQESLFEDTHRWDFESGLEDWTGQQITLSHNSSDNRLVATETGDNPRIRFTRFGTDVGVVSIDASAYTQVRLFVRFTTLPDPIDSWVGFFFWGRGVDVGIDPEGTYPFDSSRRKSISSPDFYVMGDKTFLLTWDMRGVTDWDQIVTALRFDLFSYASTPLNRAVWEVDYITVETDGMRVQD